MSRRGIIRDGGCYTEEEWEEKKMAEKTEHHLLNREFIKAIVEELDKRDAFRQGFNGRLSVQMTDEIMDWFRTVIRDWYRLIEACETMSHYIQDDENCWIAMKRYCRGEDFHVSRGICGSMTYGYGDLDQSGYWQYPLPGWFMVYLKEGRKCGNKDGTGSENQAVAGTVPGSETPGKGD